MFKMVGICWRVQVYIVRQQWQKLGNSPITRRRNITVTVCNVRDVLTVCNVRDVLTVCNVRCGMFSLYVMLGVGCSHCM